MSRRKEKEMKNLKLALSSIGLSAVMLLTACGKEVEKVDYVHGTVDGNKYSSDMFGLTAEFDSDWIFLTDEELASQNGMSDMSKESAADVFSSVGIVYDMYAGKEDGSNISFIVEDLSKSNNSSLDEKGYVDATYPTLKSQLEAQGLTVDSLDRTTVTFAGNESPCIKIAISVSGISMYEYQVYKKAGQYMGVITITGFSEEDNEEMAKCFKSL
ncbi:MAG: hypothetical protein NC394_06625 [Bacteroides sp.]|nr:hypothetical protein [Bacteroides sp.]